MTATTAPAPAGLDLSILALCSRAQRDLDTEGAECRAAIDQFRASTHDELSDMTKDDIQVYAADRRVVLDPAKMTKQQMIDTFIDQFANQGAVGKRLQELELRAAADRRCAQRINAAIEEGEQARLAMLEKLSENPNPGNVLYNLAWQSGSLMLAMCRARYALRVTERIRKGHDLRDAVMTVAKQAMFEVMAFPSHVKANGTGDMYKHETTLTATAAADFVQNTAAWVMGDTVPAAWLTD